MSETKLGKRKVTDEAKLKKMIYQEQCTFNLAGIIETIKGYDLLVKYGMYSRKTNPSGVVRDHRLSIDFGFKNQIDPRIISHPANCEFIPHKANASKSSKSSITLQELLEEIGSTR